MRKYFLILLILCGLPQRGFAWNCPNVLSILGLGAAIDFKKSVSSKTIGLEEFRRELWRRTPQRSKIKSWDDFWWLAEDYGFIQKSFHPLHVVYEREDGSRLVMRPHFDSPGARAPFLAGAPDTRIASLFEIEFDEPNKMAKFLHHEIVHDEIAKALPWGKWIENVEGELLKSKFKNSSPSEKWYRYRLQAAQSSSKYKAGHFLHELTAFAEGVHPTFVGPTFEISRDLAYPWREIQELHNEGHFDRRMHKALQLGIEELRERNYTFGPDWLVRLEAIKWLKMTPP
jgi:hypothetical protein